MKKNKMVSWQQSTNSLNVFGNIMQSGMDKVLFLYKFMTSPKKIGSITPSSDFLAEAMIKPVNWSQTRSIVELGAGTGVFTRYILEYKSPDCQGIIFEQDSFMRQRLSQTYPGLYYYPQAENISSVLRGLGIKEVDYIISGLPFANLSNDLRECILNGVTEVLKPGGLFVAFQYSHHMKKHLLKRFKKVDLFFVPLNIPPALVYYCYK